MGTRRRVFPEAFKREAVERVSSSDLSLGQVAQELGLHETVLRRWTSLHRRRGQRGARSRRWRSRRRPTWLRRMPGSGGRTNGCGWSAIS